MTDNEIKRSMISAREEYINIIKSELLGPGSEFSLPDAEHELISSTPTSRYSVGILFPQGNEVNQDNDETVELEEADNSAEITDSASAEEPIADPFSRRNRVPMHSMKLPMKTWMKKSEWLPSTCPRLWVLRSSQVETRTSSEGA